MLYTGTRSAPGPLSQRIPIMNARRYHYEWAAYTDNLNLGRRLIARDRDYTWVAFLAVNKGGGCYSIRRERVYDN